MPRLQGFAPLTSPCCSAPLLPLLNRYSHGFVVPFKAFHTRSHCRPLLRTARPEKTRGAAKSLPPRERPVVSCNPTMPDRITLSPVNFQMLAHLLPSGLFGSFSRRPSCLPRRDPNRGLALCASNALDASSFLGLFDVKDQSEDRSPRSNTRFARVPRSLIAHRVPSFERWDFRGLALPN